MRGPSKELRPSGFVRVEEVRPEAGRLLCVQGKQSPAELFVQTVPPRTDPRLPWTLESLCDILAERYDIE
jgi:hypothetical protein